MKHTLVYIQRLLPAILMLICSQSDVWAQNTVKIESVSVKAGQTMVVPIILENTDNISSLQLDVTLPEGISYESGSLTLNEERASVEDFDAMFNNQTSRYTDEEKVRYTAASIYRLTVLRKSLATIVGNSGALVYITLRISDDYLQDSEINIIKAVGSYESQKIEIPDCLNIKVISLNAINNAAYSRLTQEIASLQTNLNAAKNTINTECKDVAAQFAEQTASIQNSINALTADVKAKYDAVQLTADSKIETANIVVAIEKLVEDAKSAQQAYEAEQAKIAANEAAYTRLTQEIAGLQSSLDAAKTTVNTECKDVSAQFTEQAASVQNSINMLTTDVKAKYDAVHLTADSKIETASIVTAIEKLLSDARTAQQTYEKEQANAAAYSRLTQEIASLQSSLNAAKNTVNTECKDVAAQFAEQTASIQNSINALTADVKAKYDAVELTADSKIETASVVAAIENLLSNAKTAQALFEAGETTKLANEVAYARLTQEIASLQTKLDAAKNTINTECKDVAAQFAEQTASIQNSINALTADVKAKYDAVELTADSKIETVNIVVAIKKLVEDAKSAQQVYEAELQAKIAANEATYTKLMQEIASLQNRLNAVKTTVNTECKDVAAQFAEQIANIQSVINALQSEIDVKYADCELTAESTIDTTDIVNAIEAMKKHAAEAQKKHEEAVGIHGVNGNGAKVKAIYSLDGKRVSSTKPNQTYIIKYSDGRKVKAIVKK